MSGLEFEAEIGAGDAEAEELASRLRAWLARNLGAADRFAVELLCREAVANAVRHGCGSDSSKRVRLRLELRAGLLSGSIEDEGEGFTPSIKAALFDLKREGGGLGLAIISHYADRISLVEGGRVIRFDRRLTGGI